ncbi:hypothetical protein [Allomesorhizobium camelthorni]|nr:hypothetical protein [Mesorhizobium camelthorni]
MIVGHIRAMCYVVAMAEAMIVPFHEAVKAAIWREFELAKARFGNDWQLLCIEENWGDTLDDRHTLRMLRSLNRNGSCYSRMFCRRD